MAPGAAAGATATSKAAALRLAQSSHTNKVLHIWWTWQKSLQLRHRRSEQGCISKKQRWPGDGQRPAGHCQSAFALQKKLLLLLWPTCNACMRAQERPATSSSGPWLGTAATTDVLAGCTLAVMHHCINPVMPSVHVSCPVPLCSPLCRKWLGGWQPRPRT